MKNNRTIQQIVKVRLNTKAPKTIRSKKDYTRKTKHKEKIYG
jgi:hypothetical protein